MTNIHARAYVYAGDWVADCPAGCSNVEFLHRRENPTDPSSPRTLRQPVFYCTYCHVVAPINWPDDEDEITRVLARRPLAHTRNWYPRDHPVALAAGIPHGQLVDELLAEELEHSR
jgi:hypothetical protein